MWHRDSKAHQNSERCIPENYQRFNTIKFHQIKNSIGISYLIPIWQQNEDTLLRQGEGIRSDRGVILHKDPENTKARRVNKLVGCKGNSIYKDIYI